MKLEIFSPSVRQSPKISHLHGFLTKQSPIGQEEKLFLCFRKLGWRVGLQLVTGILVSLFFFGMFYRWPVFVFVSWCICFAGGLSLCFGLFVPFCPLVPLSLCFYICLFVSLCLAVFVFTVTGQAQAFSDLPHSIIHNEEQYCTLRTKRERLSARRKTRRNSRCEILNFKKNQIYC